MGKFSGILLCSDFDSTLAVNTVIPQNNLDAIEYFCSEGGVFSVVTGRGIDFLDKYSPALKLPSYVACLNGTEIYHFPTKKMVNSALVPQSTKKHLDELLAGLECISDVRIFGLSGSTIIYKDAPYFYESVMTLMDQPARKLLLHSYTPFTDADMAYIKSIFGDEFEISRSWASGLEVSSISATKGIAARMMANLVGAHTLVCAGDYENDISMLMAADISYAVENALPSVKEIATRVTVPAKDGAIAAIIAELEN